MDLMLKETDKSVKNHQDAVIILDDRRPASNATKQGAKGDATAAKQSTALSVNATSNATLVKPEVK